METVSHKGLNFKISYTENELRSVVGRLGQQITAYYNSLKETQENLDVVAVCVLKGSFVFYSDLVRSIEIEHQNEFIQCKSYSGLQSTGKLVFQNQIKPEKFKNKSILIIQDIHDTGHTLKQIVKAFEAFEPKRIDIAVLVKRPGKQPLVDLRFHGFECGRFIVGYGLDFDEWGRHFPCIYEKIEQ